MRVRLLLAGLTVGAATGAGQETAQRGEDVRQESGSVWLKSYDQTENLSPAEGLCEKPSAGVRGIGVVCVGEDDDCSASLAQAKASAQSACAGEGHVEEKLVP